MEYSIEARFPPIKHFSHEHALQKIWSFSTAICEICGEIFKWKYGCKPCRYYVHEECAKLPEFIINHALHPQHRLMLQKVSLIDNINCCYYCDKPFESDYKYYVYACKSSCSDNFYMHMKCAMIPLPTITITSDVDDYKDHGVAQFACHQQPMTLVVDDHEHHHSNKTAAKCFGCQSSWSGPVYSCISEECENFLHKSCAELPRKIQHPFHAPHSLTLQVSKPRSCRSCCRKDCRLVFGCHEDGCTFFLGIECASLDTTVKCRSHHHLLSLVEKSSCDIRCDACQNSYDNGFLIVPNEVKHTRPMIFRCMECVFNFHFLCGPLPSKVKYEYHLHPLILSEHSVSNDDSDEYYCDICEEERDQSFRIYYCEECQYAAHIHCLIHEIMKSFKGDTKDVVLQALGENRWDLTLDIESMEDHDDHHSEELNSTESSIILKDIMDLLTEEEKEILIDPFTFNDPSMKAYRRKVYNQSRQFNSRFDREESIEDIHKIPRFYHFERIFLKSPSAYDDYDYFKHELKFFTPEEGLLKLLDHDKYSRQKVEDVDGYKVPTTLAPILKTLLRKYGGDLVGKENLTPAMKSLATTLLCIVVDKMCKTKVENITKDDLRHLYFYLTGIQKITRFALVSRYLESFKDVMKAFLGFEAIRFYKGVREKLEAEMERCKENLEKLETYASETSDFMGECLYKASEWEQMTWGDKWF